MAAVEGCSIKIGMAELHQDKLYDMLHPAKKKRQILKGRFFEEKSATQTQVGVASLEVGNEAIWQSLMK